MKWLGVLFNDNDNDLALTQHTFYEDMIKCTLR